MRGDLGVMDRLMGGFSGSRDRSRHFTKIRVRRPAGSGSAKTGLGSDQGNILK